MTTPPPLLLQVTHNPTPRGPPELLKVCVRRIAWAASECVAWNSVQVARGPSLCLHLTCIKNVMKLYANNIIILNTEDIVQKLHLFSTCRGKATAYGETAVECRKDAMPEQACSIKLCATPVLERAVAAQAERIDDPEAVLLRGRDDD